MAYTEFYCDPVNGNQMNGGSDAGSSPSYSATNGGWSSVTGVFTPTSGNPSLSVTVGQFAAVFTDGTTTPSFVGRVTAVNSTTVTVSVTIKIGTVPTTAGSGLSINVGGAWKGPNGASAWPVGSMDGAIIANSTGNPVRVNLKNNSTYSITSGLTQNKQQITYQGYGSSVDDGGRATIDGSTNAIILWTNSGVASQIIDLIFSNNGSSGTNAGVSVSGSATEVIRCVVHDVRGSGFLCNANSKFVECEAYACNSSNTATFGGFANSGGTTVQHFIRCIAHDNTGSNNDGFSMSATSAAQSMVLLSCIADTNGRNGVSISSSGTFGGITCINCEFYNNGSHGFNFKAGTSTASTGYFENCNFIKNGGWGINGHTVLGAGSGAPPAILVKNCGFGSGTQVNTSGTTTGVSIQELSSVTYASNVTPWVAPDNGDFRINLAAAIAAGRGAFTQTAASYAGASSSPVIGACQVADYPTQANVNNGTTYANGAYTGSLSGGGGGLIRPPGLDGGMQK